jgi:hypothetical protein
VTAPGVNLEQWLKIYDTIEGLNTLLPVDLIWLEEAPDGLRSKILAEALEEPESNPLAIDGTIQRFEFVYELFWKTFKNLLETEGITTYTPKEAL